LNQRDCDSFDYNEELKHRIECSANEESCVSEVIVGVDTTSNQAIWFAVSPFFPTAMTIVLSVELRDKLINRRACLAASCFRHFAEDMEKLWLLLPC